jgi:hypothetical protein
MLIFIKKRSDSFLPHCVSHGPWFQHAVRMNYIGPIRPLMPALRTDGTILPQPVHGQNVQISVEHRGDKLI